MYENSTAKLYIMETSQSKYWRTSGVHYIAIKFYHGDTLNYDRNR